jgi:hypothetical protein
MCMEAFHGSLEVLLSLVSGGREAHEVSTVSLGRRLNGGIALLRRTPVRFDWQRLPARRFPKIGAGEALWDTDAFAKRDDYSCSFRRCAIPLQGPASSGDRKRHWGDLHVRSDCHLLVMCRVARTARVENWSTPTLRPLVQTLLLKAWSGHASDGTCAIYSYRDICTLHAVV